MSTYILLPEQHIKRLRDVLEPLTGQLPSLRTALDLLKEDSLNAILHDLPTPGILFVEVPDNVETYHVTAAIRHALEDLWDPILKQLVVIVARKGFVIQSYSEAEMEKLGWVRK